MKTIVNILTGFLFEQLPHHSDPKNWVCLLLMKKTMKHYLCTGSVQTIFIESKKVFF